MRGYILLAFFIASLPVCLVRPFYGILIWTVVAFLNPQAYIWNAVSFPWALSIAIPTLIGFLFFAPGWARRLSGRECWMLFVLWIWFTITSVASVQNPLFIHHAADTWDRWELVSKILLMTALTIALVRDFSQLRRLVLVIAGCFAFLILKALPFMILTGGRDRLYGPERSMVADNNDVGLALNMTLPIFFFLARSESNPWLRRACVFFFLASIPAVFLTYSRGGVLGLVVVLLLMLLQSKRRLILLPSIVLAAALVMLFAPPQWKHRMDPTRSDAIDASARSRFNAWTFAFRLAADNPVTGGGFATFTPKLFDRYAPDPRQTFASHSIYFGVLAEHGFVGLALYLGLIASVLVTVSRLARLARRNGDTQVEQYALMLRFSLIGFLVSGAFLARSYFDYFFTIVACVAILKRLYMETLQDTPDEYQEEPVGEEVA